VVLVILVLFGSKRIPDLARSLGKVTREIRRATRQIKDEIEHGASSEPPGSGSGRPG
jgi:sec-independent protein translocase protein TatA